MRRIFSILALSLWALPALAADLSGAWTINGPVQPHCTITQTANQLSGSCKGPQAQGPLSGTVDGQAVQFTFQRTGLRGGQMAPVTFSGTFNGASISGTATIGANAGGSFTAQRDSVDASAASAPQSSPSAQSAPAPTPLAIDNAPLKTVWDSDMDGSAIHQITGMVCPNTSGPFKRNQLTMYDKVGFDVSCNYRMANADITIYLTMRDPSLLQKDFESAKSALVAITPGAMPRAGTLMAPQGMQWLQAAFDEQGGVRSDILLSQLSGWEYEIRATFSPENEAVVTAAITDFAATVRRTAGAHLAACKGTQPADGTGPRNQNLDAMLGLVTVSAVIVKAAVTTPRPGMEWCPDIGFGIGKGDYVWWHNITPANDGPVIRISSIKGDIGNTVFVVRVPAALAKAVEQKLGGKVDIGNDDLYALAVDSPQSTKIAGIFNGRPSFKDVTGLVLQKAFGVYAEIKKPDGAITLYKPF